MYRILSFTFLASLIAMTSAARVWAQNAPGGNPGPVSKPAQEHLIPPTAATSAADPPSMTLRINGGTMASVVEEIQDALEKANKPPVNVLLGPGVQDVKVPPLTLRKVSGTDALNLVAASSGCRLDSIKGERGDAIGYKIVVEPQWAPGSRRQPWFDGTDVPGNSLRAAPGTERPDRNAPTTAPPIAGGPALPAIPGMLAGSPLGKAAENPVVSFTSPGKPASTVRVYGLGEITTMVKFSEVMQSLEEALKTAGIPPESMKLGVHEKTNVLIVTGDQRVHELVGQFVLALEKNTASAAAQRSQGEEAKRQLIQSEVRLQAQEVEKKRLEKRLSDSEAELNKVQRELDRIRTTASPKAQ